MKELQDKGLGLAAISYDPPATLADFSRRRGITFPLLSDAGSATIKGYGLLNPLPEDAQGPNKSDPAVAAEVQKYVSVVRPNAGMIGIAFPGTFLLDRRGRVTSRFFEDFYIERNTVSSLMMRLGGKAESVAASGRFQVVTHKMGESYPDPTLEKLPAAIAITHPPSPHDFGGTRDNPLAPSVNQVLVLFTLRPSATATAPAYTIRLGKNSLVSVGKNGSCLENTELPISASFRLDRKAGRN